MGFTSLGGRAVEANTIKVAVYYSAGGLSFYDYKNYPRGFYLSVTPVTVEESAGLTSESYALGTAAGFFLEAATRFNGKRLEALARYWLPFKGAIAETFRKGTLAEFMASEGGAGVKEATESATPMRMAGDA